MPSEKIIQRQADEHMLAEFLEQWPIGSLHEMSLREYNHVGDKETFCQCIETKTRPLGSIKGNNSTKFGIYRQLNKESRPPNSTSNKNYTWETKFNPDNLDENSAFEQVITNIQQIANFAMAGDFEAVEHQPINSLFRWKVAYLYSENCLIPIFAKTKLIAIVRQQGMDANNHTPYYEMQKYLMARKPFDMTVVEYMRELFEQLRGKKKQRAPIPKKKNRHRRPVRKKRGGRQERSGHKGYTADLFHDDLQQALYEQLCLQHLPENVLMENDWVDIMVELPDKVIIYEIKSARYAAECLSQGIGQALGYAFRVRQSFSKPVELVIAGPNEYFENEREFIDFLKDQLLIPISYLKIDYEPLD